MESQIIILIYQETIAAHTTQVYTEQDLYYLRACHDGLSASGCSL